MQTEVEIYQARGKYPLFAYEHDAGFDLSWNPTSLVGSTIHEQVSRTISPGMRVMLETGTHIALKPGWEAQVRPRSGLAKHSGIMIVNSPGTVDAGYRGEIHVILYNSGSNDYTVHSGDRIAQVIISQVPNVKFIRRHNLSELPQSERGVNGHGSSGR